ncbi:hypothetical protein JKP88DRAFT_261312 [Tribonema minus]|uniref:E3 ubiquitin-protein ligase n=1 Tax=Tribonema minus TaxID=303371 RepID=A0A836CB31_9STRA|nr:hypothetical protein JKP88DRAFT_261312 [Tribonema minus]
MAQKAVLHGVTGTVLWQPEAPTVLPDPPIVAAEVYAGDAVNEALLQALVAAVLDHQPLDSITSWLNWLASGNPRCLDGLQGSTTRRICGYVFKRGDIAWNCLTCQCDPTAVQETTTREVAGALCICVALIHAIINPNHFPSFPAVQLQQCDSCFRQSSHVGHKVFFHRTNAGGCCDCGDEEAWATDGCCPTHSAAAATVDPLASLPPLLLTGARATVRAILDFATTVVWDCVHSFEGAERNRWLKPSKSAAAAVEGEGEGAAGGAPVLVVRLHNDDVHTFDHVISVLVQLSVGVRTAAALARMVDEGGHALIVEGSASEVVENVNKLKAQGLLASAAPKTHLQREERLGRALAWLDAFGSRSEGLCRLIAQELVRAQDVCSPQLQPETPRSSTILAISQRAPAAAAASPGAAAPTLSSDADPPLFSPFPACPLLLLMLADPLLLKQQRSAAHALFMRLLTDAAFKRAFAAAFGRAFRALHALFARGVGTSSESLFGFSVQIFTTPSLVQLLDGGSGDASELCSALVEAGKSPLPEGSAQGMLVQCLLDSFRTAGCGRQGGEGAEGDKDAFLDHGVVSYRRFSHVFSDLEYVLSSPGSPPRLSVAEHWLGLLSDLQGMDAAKRQLGTHVEYELQRWMSAFGISLALTSVSEVLIGRTIAADAAAATADTGSNGGSGSSGGGGSGGGGSGGDALVQLADAAMRAVREWLARQPTAPNGGVTVQAGLVSPHLPLHRFVAQLVQAAVEEGRAPPLRSAGAALSADALGLMEYPLRVLVWHAQVMVGLWVRNGVSAHSQAVNYASPPLCRQLRNLDFVALQYAATVVGPDVFMHTYLERFGLRRWITDPQFSPLSPPRRQIPPPELIHPDKYAPLAEHCLLLLTVLVTELPRSAAAAAAAGGDAPSTAAAALRRELIHRLAVEECTHSEAAAAAVNISGSASGADADVDAALAAVAVRSGGGGSGGAAVPRKYDLAPAAAREFSPAYPHLRQADAHTAAERVAAKLRAAAGAVAPKWGTFPAVGPPPPCAAALLPARWLLFSADVLSAVSTVLAHCLERTARRHSETLLARCVHLVTLQLHCLAEAPATAAAAAAAAERASAAAAALAEGVPAAGASAGRALTPAEYFAWLRQPRRACALSAAHGHGSVLAMLAAIARGIGSSGGGGDGGGLDPLFRTGLEWVLAEAARRDKASAAMLQAADVLPRAEAEGGGGGGGAAEGKEAKAAVRRRMQQEAMAAMAKRQAAFAQHMGLGDSEEETEEGEEGGEGGAAGGEEGAEVVAEAPLAREKGAPVCIVCHESVNRNMCYGAVAQRSTVMSRAIGCAPEHELLNRQFRVVGNQGCQLRESVELNSRRLGLLPRNAEVTIVEQRWGRLRLHVGLCGHAAHAHCMEAYRATLRERHNMNQAYRTTLRERHNMNQVRHPVVQLKFMLWLTVSTCCVQALLEAYRATLRERHNMNQAYRATLRERHNTNQAFDGRVAINVPGGEFMCPLCKNLGNVLVPHIPPALRASALAEAAAPEALAQGKPVEPAQLASGLDGLVTWLTRRDDRGHTGLHSTLLAGHPDPALLPPPLRAALGDAALAPLEAMARALDVLSRPPRTGDLRPVTEAVMRRLHIVWAAVAHAVATAEAASRVAAAEAAHAPAAAAAAASAGVVRAQELLSAARLARAAELLPQLLHSPSSVLSTEEGGRTLSDTVGAGAAAALAAALAAVLGGAATVPSLSAEEAAAVREGAALPLPLGRRAWWRRNLDAPLQVVWDRTTLDRKVLDEGQAPQVLSALPRAGTLAAQLTDRLTARNRALAAADAGASGGGGSGAISGAVGDVTRVAGGDDSGGSGGGGGGTVSSDASSSAGGCGGAVSEESAVHAVGCQWPVLQVPLLAWDLSTLAAALATLVHSAEQRRAAVRAVCLARLAQLCVQPEFCLLGTVAATAAAAAEPSQAAAVGAADEAAAAAAAAALEAQRGALAEEIGLAVAATAPRGAALLHAALAAWLPFLRYAVLLLTVVEGEVDEADATALSTDARLAGAFRATAGAAATAPAAAAAAAAELCAVLDIPMPAQAWANDAVRALVRRWGLQYAAAYDRPSADDLQEAARWSAAAAVAAAAASAAAAGESAGVRASPYLDARMDSMPAASGSAGLGGAAQPLFEGLGAGGDMAMDEDSESDDEEAVELVNELVTGGTIAGIQVMLNIMQQGQDGGAFVLQPMDEVQDSDEGGGGDDDDGVEEGVIDLDAVIAEGLAGSEFDHSEPAAGDAAADDSALPDLVSDSDASGHSEEPELPAAAAAAATDAAAPLRDVRSLRRRRPDNERSSARRRPRLPATVPAPPPALLPFLGTAAGGVPTQAITGRRAASCAYDLSHGAPAAWHAPRLVALPRLFTELYARVKGPYTALAHADFDPAVCLLCGRVLAAAHKLAAPGGGGGGAAAEGACTAHARACGGDVGVFFLVQRCQVLLARGGRAAYWASLYLDEHGEEDVGLRRGRPLYLSEQRYGALRLAYAQHRIAQEVTAIRASSDRVIRENFY